MKSKIKFVILPVLFLVIVLLSGCIYLPGDVTSISFLPVVQTFQASPAVIKAGEYSTLTWSVTGASKVYIDTIGNVALKGSLPVSPASTTYYVLTASNSSGNTTARTQIIVTGSSQQQLKPPAILSFFSDNNNVNPGQAVTLYWSTSETTQVTLDPGGIVNAQGSQTVYPYATSDYVLTASNSYGTTKSKLTIVVNSSIISQTGQEKIVVLPIVYQESGSLVKNNAVYSLQYGACAGDTSTNLASRAFLSFNIAGIPQNAVINEAVLDLSSYTQIGNPSYTASSLWGNMGALEFYFYQYGTLNDLDTLAYNRAGTMVSGGSVTSYPLSPWRLDVRYSDSGEPVIQNLVQTGQPRCQFRIQFFTSTNWDSKADMFCFDGAKLIIKYTVP